MLKKFNITVIVILLNTTNIFAEVSKSELIKGVFFGAGPVSKKVEYIKKSYSLSEKLSGSNLAEAESITDKLTAKVIEKHPIFAKNFTAAVNKGDLIEVLHHVEQADTILTSLYEEQDNYNPDATGVAVVAVAVVAVAVHNAVAVTSVAVVAVAAAVKLALMTTNDEDSLLHREKLSMELSRSLKR